MNHLSKLARSGALTVTAFALSSLPVLAQSTISIEAPEGGVTNVGNFISAAIQFAIMFAAILTFAFLVWGGIEWITSGGDKSKYEAARNRITAALVGLVIVAAAWAIMTVAAEFLNLDSWNSFSIPNAQTGN